MTGRREPYRAAGASTLGSGTRPGRDMRMLTIIIIVVVVLLVLGFFGRGRF
jgi:hypothetical protein